MGNNITPEDKNICNAADRKQIKQVINQRLYMYMIPLLLGRGISSQK